ncbi:MAG: ribulose-phosphate 3-epimerase [Caldilineales bacterium]|nr:ribulose-phosphate 3-epimerase [Caldilineales bacterium]
MSAPSRTKIAASILTADFGRLAAEVAAAEAAGVDWLHVDVMDGSFVPNLTIGPLVVRAIRAATQLPVDVHLMIHRPEALIPAFAEAGADRISVHVEACLHLQRTLQQIKDLGLKTGVALNPATPLSQIEEVLDDLDLALVMSVNPGFGGQTYLPGSTDKIARLAAMLAARGRERVEIQVDGGIKLENAAAVAAAGATVLVIGSAIFNRQASIAENIAGLRAALAGGS